MVGIFGAKARQERLPAIGAAVAVGVGEMHQLGAVSDVCAAVPRLDARGDEEAVGEDGCLVGLAVAVAIFEHHDPVVRHLPRQDLRVDLGTGDPEPAGRIEVHLDRLGDQRVGRVERNLEALGHLERLPLELGIGKRNLLELALGESRGHNQQDNRAGQHSER